MNETDLINPETRAAYDRHAHGNASDHDLLLMATSEAERAMLSLPPHCLPNERGLPHNEDHANACAHRCWSFLTTLSDRRVREAARRICDEVDTREDLTVALDVMATTKDAVMTVARGGQGDLGRTVSALDATLQVLSHRHHLRTKK